MTVYAYTRIKYGKKKANGEVVRLVFEPGEPVTGLPRKVMENLLEAGAIAKYDRTAVEGQMTDADLAPPPPSSDLDDPPGPQTES